MDIVYSSTKENRNSDPEAVYERAYAKINLCLDVTGKRPDGYHDLRMIMQTVDLYDELEIRIGKKEAEQGKITLIMKELPEGADLGPVEKNLIWRAARLFLDEYHLKTSVIITLTKRIPVAAGLAGGSSDAAAAIRGLNRLLAIGASEEEMCALGVKIGADVPYCIRGGTMLAEGIGEVLSPLPNPPSCYLLLAKPPVDVSTGYVYDHLRLDDPSSHPDVDRCIEALVNQDLAKLASNLGNILETVTEKEYSVITVMKSLMKEAGAAGTLMSGSGPTVFGLFENIDNARYAKQLLEERGLSTRNFVTGFV
ncbi:MAG: 4-(cytidine 5'-diphospho)-2-C-methyl-D-erythritol kinase [Lachnospiraceae bacterium]|nr:4-(cytidine 5'-diphospho)-2-C-methyl-D-erythritol kinase [Lachnospiraceae bacterium]